jgi:signal transduction histidine kinase
MQQLGHGSKRGGARQGRAGADRKRVEVVVETLATLRAEGDSLSAVAHDARNMVTALGLYCDLLDEPGVLAAPYRHYGNELRLVAAASRRLVEKLVALDAEPILPEALGEAAASGMRPHPLTPSPIAHGPLACDPFAVTDTGATGQNLPAGLATPATETGPARNRRVDFLPAVPVADLARELAANCNLLSALAGPSIVLTMEAAGGAKPVRITGEDLTRVLVNLVKNAAEAMPCGGRVHIALSERGPAGAAEASVADRLVLTVQDNGPGVPIPSLEEIFDSGYTTRGNQDLKNGDWPSLHRGLGLAISRSIVEAAGGSICARNQESGGARFEIELPVGKGGL